MRSEQFRAVITASGGVSVLAKGLGLDASTVSGWREVPSKRVPAVAELSGLPMSAIRPDLYPPGMAEAQAPLDACVCEAKALGLDPAAISAAALRQAIGDEKARRWVEENREAIEAHNAWIEEHGLPLAHLRLF